MEKKKAQFLIEKALLAREKAYVPYSHFAVGAALLSEDEQVYLGCNIENASYSCVNCAERTAVFKAVSEGIKSFKAIAIVGGKEGSEISDYSFPCGVCRQILREFCNPETFEVIVAVSKENFVIKKLTELLPESFGPENLK